MATRTQFLVTANLRTMEHKPYNVFSTLFEAQAAMKALSITGISSNLELNPRVIDGEGVNDGPKFAHWPPSEIVCFVISEITSEVSDE